MCDHEPTTVSSVKDEADADESLSAADHSLQSRGESCGASLGNDVASASFDSSTLGARSAKSLGHQSSDDQAPADLGASRSSPGRWSMSLREYMGLLTIVILMLGLVFSIQRLRRLEVEVVKLRTETGYLQQTDAGQIAAARAPSDQPLTYRIRVRVPAGSIKFRVAYSSVWPRQSVGPEWFGAVPVPPGESVVTIRILEDPRDKKWKIASLVASVEGNQRMATVLPPGHVQVFRGSYDVLSTGLGRETQSAQPTESIRLLDERWLVGEGGLLLYGDRAPEIDQVGIYAELQPDVGPL